MNKTYLSILVLANGLAGSGCTSSSVNTRTDDRADGTLLERSSLVGHRTSGYQTSEADGEQGESEEFHSERWTGSRGTQDGSVDTVHPRRWAVFILVSTGKEYGSRKAMDCGRLRSFRLWSPRVVTEWSRCAARCDSYQNGEQLTHPP